MTIANAGITQLRFKLQNYGQIYGNSLAQSFELKNICIPDQYGTKDSSDTYQTYGPYTLNDIINTLTCLEQSE